MIFKVAIIFTMIHRYKQFSLSRSGFKQTDTELMGGSEKLVSRLFLVVPHYELNCITQVTGLISK